MSASNKPDWGSSYRLIAADKWKAKSAAMGRDVTQAIVDYAQARPGMKILDLASGTGEPAISLASRVEPGGEITALDLSAELLEIAADRARERKLTNLAIKRADAHELPFADNTFDLITSRFGVMFFEKKALQEAVRVLKPGARACFLAWGPFEQPFWLSMMGVVHKHVGGASVQRRDRTLAAMGSPAAFRRRYAKLDLGRLRRDHADSTLDLARSGRRSLGASAGHVDAVSPHD